MSKKLQYPAEITEIAGLLSELDTSLSRLGEVKNGYTPKEAEFEIFTFGEKKSLEVEPMLIVMLGLKNVFLIMKCYLIFKHH